MVQSAMSSFPQPTRGISSFPNPCHLSPSPSPPLHPPRYQLWILLSGINFPDLLTPYYERRPVSAFFFVIYLLLGYFFLARLVLAIAFKSYKQDCHTRLITRWHRSLDGMQVSHHLYCQPCQPSDILCPI